MPAAFMAFGKYFSTVIIAASDMLIDIDQQIPRINASYIDASMLSINSIILCLLAVLFPACDGLPEVLSGRRIKQGPCGPRPLCYFFLRVFFVSNPAPRSSPST